MDTEGGREEDGYGGRWIRREIDTEGDGYRGTQIRREGVTTFSDTLHYRMAGNNSNNLADTAKHVHGARMAPNAVVSKRSLQLRVIVHDVQTPMRAAREPRLPSCTSSLSPKIGQSSQPLVNLPPLQPLRRAIAVARGSAQSQTEWQLRRRGLQCCLLR